MKALHTLALAAFGFGIASLASCKSIEPAPTQINENTGAVEAPPRQSTPTY